jgi:hypothetical protein
MGKGGDLLSQLPGSRRNDGGDKVVSNHTLIPTLNKLPGQTPPQARDTRPPPAHLLGSGGTTPESQNSRMLSQFAIPDPLSYGNKKRKVEETSSDDDGTWTTHEVRLAVPCSPYKTNTKVKTSGPGVVTAPSTANNTVETTPPVQSMTISERQKLMGEKQYLLTRMSSDPSIKFGDARMTSTLGAVGQINQKLGLPVNHYGAFKLPPME